eukprot:CAMPEP_0113729356 /NCGR_PEP_ID=MMETSP0038_2-20120614/42501_1 /TAXON_ID=2898 /ORGANISM="Cryptomonas paramecium" /LENGTH=92 /DNA_ID=CAMNT_0000661183 /DNA_START=365 /DNA_END=643 /DNA_ORIENTATION=- /assembly_acc=CAM_ASM_000170
MIVEDRSTPLPSLSLNRTFRVSSFRCAAARRSRLAPPRWSILDERSCRSPSTAAWQAFQRTRRVPTVGISHGGFNPRHTMEFRLQLRAPSTS